MGGATAARPGAAPMGGMGGGMQPPGMGGMAPSQSFGQPQGGMGGMFGGGQGPTQGQMQAAVMPQQPLGGQSPTQGLQPMTQQSAFAALQGQQTPQPMQLQQMQGLQQAAQAQQMQPQQPDLYAQRAMSSMMGDMQRHQQQQNPLFKGIRNEAQGMPQQPMSGSLPALPATYDEYMKDFMEQSRRNSMTPGAAQISPMSFESFRQRQQMSPGMTAQQFMQAQQPQQPQQTQFTVPDMMARLPQQRQFPQPSQQAFQRDPMSLTMDRPPQFTPEQQAQNNLFRQNQEMQRYQMMQQAGVGGRPQQASPQQVPPQMSQGLGSLFGRMRGGRGGYSAGSGGFGGA